MQFIPLSRPMTIRPLVTSTDVFRLSEDLLTALRQRVDAKYYNQPQVIEIIARAILHSREVYP